jgi:Contractile injection system tube protein
VTTFPNSPRLLKAGLVLVNPESQTPERVIALQYNPESVSRTLVPQAIPDSPDRSNVLRLKGPAVETIKVTAEIDATDQLEFSDLNPAAVESGIQRDLAVLETLVHPSSDQIVTNNTLASLGTLEIAPMETPLTLFVWGKLRIVPVRVTELSITEEAFDPALNPIRAKVNLGFRVLSVNDLGFDHRGAQIFMSYLRAKEQLAGAFRSAALSALGMGRLP